MFRIAVAFGLLAGIATAQESDRLRQDIASLRFLRDLGLAREQVAALLPIAAEGARLHRDFDRERDWLYVTFHGALQRFKEEDLKDQGLSAEVMAVAGGTDHLLKELGNRTAAALAPYEEQAAAFLSPEQRRLAFPGTEDRHLLDLLREMRGSDYDEWRDRLARVLAKARVDAGLVARGDDRAERLRLAPILNEVRKWDATEYAARREVLLRALVPGRERSQIESEIRRIYRARYGQAGPLAEHLFRARMLPILAERAGLPTPVLPAPPPSERTLPGRLDRVRYEVDVLKAEINLLNLMNGLHLDIQQLTEMLRAARGVAEVQVCVEEMDEARQLPALREVYAALRCGEPAPQGAIAQLQSPLEKRGSGYLAARAREVREAQEAGVERMLKVLLAEHGEVIRNYNPCLIPPQDLRDPVRAGQANDTGPLEAVVDRLRAVTLGPDAQRDMDRLVSEIEEHEGPLPAQERDCDLMLMLGVACEAQALDQAAYAAKRAELAGRLAPLRRLPTLKERLYEVEGDATVIRAKISAFLLDPRIIPLAEDRIVRLRDPAKQARPDVPKAEICEDGKCGKP